LKSRNPISDYEISIIKKLHDNNTDKQDILFQINLFRHLKNQKTINIARIDEILKLSSVGDKEATLTKQARGVSCASDSELNNFNKIINEGDLKAKLSPFIEEHKLIIKAREAMVSAISVFNSPQFNFAVENFLSLSCIGWTALLQSISQDKNISIKESNKYHSLSFLLKQLTEKDIINKNISANLEAIIELRDSITHSPHTYIPKNIISILQANCFNFNKIMVDNYGKNRGLDNIFSISLQMASFKPHDFLAKDSDNKLEYISPIKEFEDSLDKEILESSEYKCNIIIVPTSVNRENQADFVYIAKPNSEEAEEISKIIFKSKITIDKAKNYPHEFRKIVKMLEKDYRITTNILSDIIRTHSIKENEIYAYEHIIGSTSTNRYSYSQEFINFLKTKLEKLN
jgi:hypothetical protein